MQFSIYGTNTDFGALCPEASVLAGTHEVMTFDAIGAFAEPSIEFEKVEFVDAVLTFNKITQKFSIEMREKNYNDGLNFESFYAVDVLNKKFHYLQLNDYKLKPSAVSATDCFRAAFVGYSVSDEKPFKKIKLEFEAK